MPAKAKVITPGSGERPQSTSVGAMTRDQLGAFVRDIVTQMIQEHDDRTRPKFDEGGTTVGGPWD